MHSDIVDAQRLPQWGYLLAPRQLESSIFTWPVDQFPCQDANF